MLLLINAPKPATTLPTGNNGKLSRYCDGSYFFLNKKTNKVIEVYNAATAILAPLGQMPNTLDANQRWYIEK